MAESKRKSWIYRMSVKYTEPTHSQSGTQDLKQCQIIQCNRCSVIVQKMGSLIMNNTVYCLCQSSKGWRHIHIHVTCVFNKLLAAQQARNKHLTVGFTGDSGNCGVWARVTSQVQPDGQAMAKKAGHPISCPWPIGHGFEYPCWKQRAVTSRCWCQPGRALLR